MWLAALHEREKSQQTMHFQLLFGADIVGPMKNIVPGFGSNQLASMLMPEARDRFAQGNILIPQVFHSVHDVYAIASKDRA